MSSRHRPSQPIPVSDSRSAGRAQGLMNLTATHNEVYGAPLEGLHGCCGSGIDMFAALSARPPASKMVAALMGWLTD
jgi:hypothetical protein